MSASRPSTTGHEARPTMADAGPWAHNPYVLGLRTLLGVDAEETQEQACDELQDAWRAGPPSVLLLGSGQLGRTTLNALRSRGVDVIGFLDNDPGRWDTYVDGLRVYPPSVAATLFGGRAQVVLAFQAAAETLRAAEARLRSLGFVHFLPFDRIFRAWPDVVGWPCGEPGLYRRNEDALAALIGSLADEESARQLLGHLEWRLTRRLEALPQGTTSFQYFEPLLVPSDAQSVFVDGGAYDGDSVRAFLSHHHGAFASVHAFEPDAESYRRLVAFVATLQPQVRERIRTHGAALGAEDGCIGFSSMGSHLSGATVEGVPTPCRALDSVMHGGTVTHVKLDVEGSERLALQGACDTISRHQPLLTVAIYHRPEDLFELPRLVSQLCPDHRLHIRTHNRFGLDIVLYAVPA